MAQLPNSPERRTGPPLGPEEFSVQPEQLPTQSEAPVGKEHRAEQQPERTVLDQQMVLPPVSTDDSSDNAQLQSSTSTQPASISGDMPASAEDLDVIERAWVNKAKQIIKNTRDDPRAQEEEFEKLQIEYHKKRYGRDIQATR